MGKGWGGGPWKKKETIVQQKNDKKYCVQQTVKTKNFFHKTGKKVGLCEGGSVPLALPE